MKIIWHMKWVMTLYLIVSGSAFAQNDPIAVSATASITTTRFNNAIRDQAIADAELTALRKYVATLPIARQRFIQEREEEFLENRDKFIIETSVQQEERNREGRYYSIAIVSLINGIAVEAFATDSIEVEIGSTTGGNDFGVMFVARVETSRRSFEDQVSTVNESDQDVLLEEEFASDAQSSVDTRREQSISVDRSGGSAESRQDVVMYTPDISMSEEVRFSASEHLVNAGFEPLSIDQLDGVPYLDEITEEMNEAGRMPTRLIRQYQDAAIAAGWAYLGIGLIDVGVPERDTVRGTVRVPATVTFEVWALSDGRARTVASVRPQVVYGQDRGNASAAETVAYNEAVAYALSTVIGQLQGKGLN